MPVYFVLLKSSTLVSTFKVCELTQTSLLRYDFWRDVFSRQILCSSTSWADFSPFTLFQSDFIIEYLRLSILLIFRTNLVDTITVSGLVLNSILYIELGTK